MTELNKNELADGTLQTPEMPSAEHTASEPVGMDTAASPAAVTAETTTTTAPAAETASEPVTPADPTPAPSAEPPVQPAAPPKTEEPVQAAPNPSNVPPQTPPYQGYPGYYPPYPGYPPYQQAPGYNPYGQPAQPANPYSQNIPQQPLLTTPSSKTDKKKEKAEKAPSGKKGHPVLTVLLSAVLGLTSGVGGAFAVNHFTKAAGNEAQTVIIHENALPEASETSSIDPAPVIVGTDLPIQQIAAKAAPSVVEIKVEAEVTAMGFFGPNTYKSESAGSGVIISDDGYIITNNHVIEGAETCTVTLYDGTVYDAKFIGTDAKSDIGVIKIDAKGLRPATIGDSSKIQVGDLAIAIGNPLGTLGGTVTNGIISATNRQVTIGNEIMNLIQTNAEINSGNSGGGLFNGQGDLIGIVNAKDSGVISNGSTIEGLGFAIPINEAMDIAEQLISNGEVVNRATLGVTVQTLAQDSQGYKAGLYIAEVASGSGADNGGLKRGDRIVKADGSEISGYPELSAVLKKHKPGDTITVIVERDGEEEEHSVTLTGPVNAPAVEESSDN